ncbi:hypothetical protein C2G38_111338 [Gigaspora rosea]|uniref:Peptidase S1 domain-containing protein n=1 Tax=Gigaspora rosea TaxID=44941 RepID=A0A397UML6_9GLOM|nr:hypothetical protein C2G38_111338 [Gigaspora rosea]
MKKDYVVTAGHCTNNLNIGFNHYVAADAFFVGKMVSVSRNKYDYGLIDTSKKAKRLKIRPYISGSQNNSELFITDSIPASSHGAHLCKSGAKTKVTCGYIESFNGVFTDIDDIILIDLIFTNSITRVGDSGGSVFYFLDLRSVSLVGISTAAFVIDNATFAINAVLPLEIILDKTKLKLVTIN